MSVLPVAKVTLDRERRLCFDYGAWIRLEEATGRSVVELLDPRYISSATGVRDLLWAGLLHEDPDLTREQVTGMLTIGRLVELQRTIAEAVNASMPDAKGGGDAGPPTAGDSTG